MVVPLQVKKKKVFFTDTKWKNMNLDARSIAYYRRNPCIAAEDLLGVQLLDSQAYVLQSSWNCPNNVWACSRNWGKSFIIAIMAILKAILYENQNIYIISSVGAQAKETFGKIEELVLRKGKTSESIASLKDIVENETVKNFANVQNGGFKHAPESYEVSFYNGSSIQTLNSKPDNIRGIISILEECERYASPLRNGWFFKLEKKSGKLKCQSERKAIDNTISTCNA